VTLNASNSRPYDKDQISLDIKSLTHLLAKQGRDSPPLREILNQEIHDMKSIEVRLLSNRMLDKLVKEGKGAEHSASKEAEHSASMAS
jgi:hypothetical protein